MTTRVVFGLFSFVSDSFRAGRNRLSFPSHDRVFVGMRIMTDKGLICPTQDRVHRLIAIVNSIVPWASFAPSPYTDVYVGFVATD